MTRIPWFRISVLLLLLIPLASPAVAADKAPARHQDRGLAAWIWHAFTEIQKILLPEATVKSDSRGTMNPDGLTSAPPDGGDSHGGMNPDG
jgi:hypothetical protein